VGAFSASTGLAKHSFSILEFARRGAQQRYEELQEELASLASKALVGLRSSYSLVQSCKLIDVLKDVLLLVATHPQRVIGQLTPKAWAETFHRPNLLVATSQVSWRGRAI
jgi:hypothetical protein